MLDKRINIFEAQYIPVSERKNYKLIVDGSMVYIRTHSGYKLLNNLLSFRKGRNRIVVKVQKSYRKGNLCLDGLYIKDRNGSFDDCSTIYNLKWCDYQFIHSYLEENKDVYIACHTVWVERIK